VSPRARPGLWILAVGAPSAALAAISDPAGATSAAEQNWPAFVLVAGLILVGAVASGTGLFEAAGQRLASMPVGEVTRYAFAAALIGLVSALMNLDTAACFVTPVLVHMARTRGRGEAPVLYGSLLLCNAGSLLLPGSNLTNIIVAGHLHLDGAAFASHMAAPFVIALGLTAVVVGVAHRKDLARSDRAEEAGEDPEGPPRREPPPRHRPPPRRSSRETWFGAAVVIAATAAVVVLPNAALPVLAIGVAAAAVAISTRRIDPFEVTRTLDVPMLAGLLGIAVALGTLGRAWDVPAKLLSHLGQFATAGVAALASVTFNNLPAASLLAARVPPHPYSLLVGLDIGPNLFVTGSLSAFLWLRAARQAGAQPSVRHTAALGVVAAPLAMAGAVAVLSAASLH
jgi:arsenical pump membrane protein